MIYIRSVLELIRKKNNALNQVKLAKEKGFKDAYIINL